MGHGKVLCIADNCTSMDLERMEGCAAAMGKEAVGYLQGRQIKLPVMLMETADSIYLYDTITGGMHQAGHVIFRFLQKNMDGKH